MSDLICIGGNVFSHVRSITKFPFVYAMERSRLKKKTKDFLGGWGSLSSLAFFLLIKLFTLGHPCLVVLVTGFFLNLFFNPFLAQQKKKLDHCLEFFFFSRDVPSGFYFEYYFYCRHRRRVVGFMFFFFLLCVLLTSTWNFYGSSVRSNPACVCVCVLLGDN